MSKKKTLFELVLMTCAVLLFCITAANAQDKWLRINNQSTYWIAYVYITPSGTQNWGPDQLKGDVLPPGTSMTWTIPWSGCYIDVRATSLLGFTTKRLGLDVCGGGVWNLYDAK